MKVYVTLEENLQEPEWYWVMKSDLEEIYYDDYLPI